MVPPGSDIERDEHPQTIITVARHPILSDATRVSSLPSAWGTLYALTQLTDDVLVDELDAGTITASTTRAEVEDIVQRRAADDGDDPLRASRLRAVAAELDTIVDSLGSWPNSAAVSMQARCSQWEMGRAIADYAEDLWLATGAAPGDPIRVDVILTDLQAFGAALEEAHAGLFPHHVDGIWLTMMLLALENPEPDFAVPWIEQGPAAA